MSKKVLEVTLENVRKAFEEADDKGKAMLKNLFGASTFIKNVMEAVRSFEDACEITGDDPKALPYPNPKNDHEEALNAMHRMWIVTRALNGKWYPDWDNSNEYKYCTWFDMRNAGVGFSDSDCDYWLTSSGVGSRLCFKSAELARYAGKQFKEEYKKIMVIKK